jgi:nucleotide-binding universal stress UspA family protein
MAASEPQVRKPILVCVDLEPHSRQALTHALSLAGKQERPLLVLHVVHETGDSAGFYQHHNHGNLTAPMADIAHSMLHELVEEVLASQPELGAKVPLDTRVVAGVPANRIAEVAEQLDAELVVLISNDRKGFSRLWHGSVEDGVRKRSSRRLLVLGANRPETPPPGGVASPRSMRVAH